MSKHVVIFSHGFGVDKTDRGLFTAVAAALPEGIEVVMFDYNQVDAATGDMMVAPLSEQAGKLRRVYAETRAANPDAIIDLVCHSQGCVVAGLARLGGVRRALLLAPPSQMADIDHWQLRFGARPGTVLSREGTSRLARADGTFTLLPPSYWTDLATIDPIVLYNDLAATVEKLTVINAERDEVLGDTNFDRLNPNISVEAWPTSHNFDDCRPQLGKRITDFIRERTD